MKVKEYLQDGANWQAQCVLAYLRSRVIGSADNPLEVTRYDNCREQGYIFYMRVKDKQLNVAVYEHRNSDNICVVMCEKVTLNAPLSEDIWSAMKDKYDTFANFDCGEILDCGNTILELFQEFEEANE